MDIFALLDILWGALRGTGGGRDFIVVYTALGAILWGFLLFKVFLVEGIQVASGHNTELPKILVKYLFVAGMFACWPMAANSIFAAIKALADIFYPSLGDLFDAYFRSMTIVQANQQADAAGLTSTILGALYDISIGSFFNAIALIVLFFCYAVILLNLMGSMTILIMNLVLGPVFFALAFDRDFRPHAQHWFAAVLSYLILIPLYGAALTVAATIAGAAVPAFVNGLPSAAQVMAQLLGPLMAVGVVFSTNKIVNALVGGASGSGLGSTALGLGAIGISLIPGGAMVRSTAVAGKAVVSAAASSGKVASSQISSTARSALGK